MSFLYPAVLWGLLAVLVPLIIHLFNFVKYKKVYFSNVSLLATIKNESKSKSRLKEILVLILRCFTIICIVFAFSKPYIPNGQSAVNNLNGFKNISIYIDNSLSMSNVNKSGPLIEIAKQKAKEIIKAFSGSAKFQILTNSFEGKQQRLLSAEDALMAVDDVKEYPLSRMLSDVISKQNNFLLQLPNASSLSYIISDLQKSTFNVSAVSIDSSIKYTVIPIEASQVNNISIDTCWFESPIQQKGFIQKLHVKIKNVSTQDIDVATANLYINNSLIAPATYSAASEQTSEFIFSFECKTEAWNNAVIKIEDYPVTFDDELFFTFNSKNNLKIALINGKEVRGNELFNLFNSDSLFSVTNFNETQVDFGKLKNANLIILNQLNSINSGLLNELLKFYTSGTSLVFVPSEKIDVPQYNTVLKQFNLPQLLSFDTTKTSVAHIENKNNFFANVFEKIDHNINLPLVLKHYEIQKSTNSVFQNLLQLQNGSPFLLKNIQGNSNAYLITQPINESCGNFIKHALFVPTFYRMSLMSVKSNLLYYLTGTNAPIQIENSKIAEKPPVLKQKKGNVELIPEIKNIGNQSLLFLHNQIIESGFYSLTMDSALISEYAFNINRIESDLTSYSIDNLMELIRDKKIKNFAVVSNGNENINAKLLSAAENTQIWKFFVILSLIFMALELIVLKFFK
ncbi:MAG: BatA domain-containing protein [Bacteroidetes bacterium]|nr:BatA domain-containing protein [Bacteroidota bacterium]